jgi:transcriptional regulator with PAS, ATPase and Fis domain
LISAITKTKIVQDFNNNCAFEDFHGFLSCDNITLKMLNRGRKCAEHKSQIIWIEGEAFTGKSLLTQAIITEYKLKSTQAIDVKIFNINNDYSVDGLQDLHEQFSNIIAQSKNNLLIIKTYPNSYYETSCAKELDLMRHDLIKNQYEYILLQPLRNRQKDIEFFYQHYLKAFLTSLKPEIASDIQSLSESEIAILNANQWQGNIKEMQHLCFLIAQNTTDCSNIKNRLSEYLQSSERQISAEIAKNNFEYSQLANDMKKIAESGLNISLINDNGSIKLFNQLEREIILQVYEYFNGSKTNVAKELGLGRTTLYRKLNEYDAK